MAALVDNLRRAMIAATGLSLVAEEGGEVVGHVLLSRGLLGAPGRHIKVQVLSRPTRFDRWPGSRRLAAVPQRAARRPAGACTKSSPRPGAEARAGGSGSR